MKLIEKKVNVREENAPASGWKESPELSLTGLLAGGVRYPDDVLGKGYVINNFTFK